MLNSYGDTFIWFEGVVEDRNDPLKLGRVRVRVWGNHTGDTSKIPTEDLPWAYVGQDPTSASINGIGRSPTGLVEGSRVFGFWRDGESMQEPVILSVIGGVSNRSNKETRSTNTTTSGERKAVYNGGIDPETNDFVEPLKNIERNPNLDINLLVLHCTATKPTADIGVKEINAWHVARGWSEIGYHFVIRRNGVIENGRSVTKQGAHARGYNRKSIGISLVGGVDSNNNPENNFTNAQWQSLENLVSKYRTEYEGIKIIGHNEVSSKACPSFDVQKWLEMTFPDSSVDKEELNSLEDSVVENKEGLKQLQEIQETRTDLGETEAFSEDISNGRAFLNPIYPENNFGFRDPNGVYPKEDFIGEQDVNRLSRNENLTNTIVNKKNENRELNIPLSFSGTWEEPESPYNAKYPLNHTIESESGHVMEIDDTRGHERIHIYHRSGTYEEKHPNGDNVKKIIGNNYEIIAKDDNVYIKGSCNITVDNNANIFVKGDLNAEVLGNFKADISGATDIHGVGEIVVSSDTKIKMDAPTIELN